MKTRPSKLDAHAERLAEWFAAGKSLKEAQDQLKADGCSVSLGRLSEWWQARQAAISEQRMFELIASGGRMNKELDAAFEKNPEPGIEQLIKVTKTLILSLQVQGAMEPEMLRLANSMQQTVLNYLSGQTRAELEARKIELSESKYRDQVAEHKRTMEAELSKAKSSGGITPETLEKIEAELKLL